MRPATASLLSSVSLPYLKSLKVDFTDCLLNTQDMFSVLNAHKSSLTSLSLSLSYGKFIEEIRFPIFEHLTKLELHLWCEVARLVGDTTTFTSLFPRVTNLDLSGLHSPIILETLFPIGFLATQVVSLAVPLTLMHMNREVVFRLATGFPGLKTLHTPALSNQNTLESIFEWMLGLEVLHISWLEALTNETTADLRLSDVDSVLTGIPRHVCHDLRLTGRGRWDTLDLDALKTKPGLSDLKGKPTTGRDFIIAPKVSP